MQARALAFSALIDKLRNSLAAGDWESIPGLDEECRALMAALRDEDAYDPSLRKQLAELSQLYDDLQQVGRAERQRVAGELTRLNQSSQVKNAYKPLA